MKEPAQTELIVVRHGQSVWNLAGRLQGHLNSDLSPAGLRQASAIADRLAKVHPDALYSSDLGRAYQTAQRVAEATGLPITPDARLRERNLGIFQGLTVEQVRQQYPREYQAFGSGDADFIVPEGESLRQRHTRAVQCTNEIAARHAGQRVVVVTHDGVLASLFRHVLGLTLGEPRRFSLFNASLNSFLISAGQWKLGTWGDISHLAGLEVGELGI